MYLGSSTFPGAATFPGATMSGDTGGGGVPGVAGIFRTPYVQRRVPVIPPIFALLNFSVAVLRIDGQWIETDFPTEEQIDAADYYFPGGYENVVDAATASVLMNAGYTVEAITTTAFSSAVGTAIVGSSAVA